MSKIELVRETLIANLTAELNRLNAERQWVANESEWIVILKNDIHAVDSKSRLYHRQLVAYRDQVDEFAAVIATDIATVRGWTIDNLRYYVSTDCTVQSWLGWN